MKVNILQQDTFCGEHILKQPVQERTHFVEETFSSSPCRRGDILCRKRSVAARAGEETFCVVNV